VICTSWMAKVMRLCLLVMAMGRAIFAGRFVLLLMMPLRNLVGVEVRPSNVLQVVEPNH
jgi:hypothetical protein